ncbi:EF-hand domain-containing protein [Thalassovita sp.]|uniref:EF-hand domain-containing protein n=1 Tax=Thalassovita sp. TaxID=1979401 RepID=UPI0029DE643C|nr:EF-hand domain-containing protein [Thalassovita sp.]
MTIVTRITTTAFAITLAAPLLAAQIDPTIDTDEDGAYSLVELQAVVPEMTEQTFASYDVSADGLLDADEAAALQEAGLLPSKDG